MKNDKSKNIIIVLLVIIIIILGILTVLFATNTISFNNKNNSTSNTQEENNDLDNMNEEEDNKVVSKNVYNDFLNSKGYLQNFSESEHGTVTGTSYTYYDLDNNGVEELIIYIADGDEFGTNLFYTYVDEEVKFIDKIYHFGNLGYNQTDNSIVYSATRSSATYGWSYGFYVLNNNKFELVKTVGLKLENDEMIYFVNDKTITKDECDSYFEDNIYFDYNELND